MPELEPAVLRKPVPGRLFAWVKLVSWIEAAVFAALLVFWLLPGHDHATFIFGLTHGIGYIGLCLLILYATIRREAPWPLLAASLTPAGPFGTVIGIELIERRGWGRRAAPIDERVLTPQVQSVDNPPAGPLLN